MNKINGGILALLASLALTSCGKGSQQEAVSSAGEAQSKRSVPVANSLGSPHAIDPSVIASAKPTGQPCSLDSIDGNYAKQVTLKPGKPYAFRGWLLDASRQPARKFSLVLESKQDYAISATTGVSRADVGAYLKDPQLDGAGFEFAAPLAAVRPGEYKLALLVGHGSAVHSCDVEKTLIVK